MPITLRDQSAGTAPLSRSRWLRGKGARAGDDAWEHLARVPDFQGIHRAEYDRLLAWMVRDGSLRLASGRLVLGPKAERRFGRKNFMELFAVFSSPQIYTVQAADGRAVTRSCRVEIRRATALRG